MVDGPKAWRVFDAPVGGPPDADDRMTASSARSSAPPGARVSLGTLGIVGAAALIGIAALALAIGSSSGELVVDSGDPGLVGPSDRTGIVVAVVGAVARPGIYHLSAGSRVADAIDAAGGFGPRVAAEAVRSQLNLASPLADGDQVRVPSRDDPQVAAVDPGGSAGSASQLVDINHATQAELEALPGIGPVSAAKILESRRTAPFRSVEELRERGLVGEKTFEKVKPLVTAG